MADIAFVFHWPPDVMDDLPIEDLALWREKARQRLKAQHEATHHGSR
ncbi:GpE family phage tail protein [Parasedimentitalea marina]|uniref:GpE family phage tail protein n=1 Tax=Parasedimentitalea marina TaxID=2483033 RepID=A0A3T0N1K1_9RHOB|nr:GpE family phage tail protein [Parasedimentitalea marina]AZV77877.1 GpE family phage tail protein [Parasedimentitalea marina]